MSIGKILWALGGMVLIVGLIFAVSTVFVLRSTVAEANEVREKTEHLLEELRRETDMPSVPAQAFPIDLPDEAANESESENAQSTIGLDRTFVFRVYEGKIGIFTAEGYLIRTLDVDLRTLPAADREALEQGIRVTSWKEMAARIEDLER